MSSSHITFENSNKMEDIVYNNDSDFHNKTDYEITNDPDYEFVNGHDEEYFSQTRKELDTPDNHEQKDLSEQSNEALTFLKEYIEITQQEGSMEQALKSMNEINDQNKKQEGSMEQALKSMNEINDQNKKLQSENDKLKKDNDQLFEEKRSVENNYVKAKDYYESRIRDLELKLQEQSNEANVHKAREQTKEIVASLQNQLSDKENNIRDLRQKNAKLKGEASKYQSALGNAMNVRLGNDDQNHSVQLKQDILDLQRTLENYVTNLKNKTGINIREVNILIKQVGCRKEITPENLDKPFIKAVLQRKVLQQIFELVKNYRKHRGENFTLESEIDVKANEFLTLIKKFSETRVGTDETSKVAEIKIRQQIYEILGNRGFSDIIPSQNNEIQPNNFIYHSSKTLNEMMNQYRQINDTERKNEVEKLAPILIRDVYRIFWFRLKVQEPIPDFKFFRNSDKVNPDLMTGRWEDDELDNICVDLCYFPVVGRDLGSDYKVITLAKVLPRPIHNQLNSNEEESEQIRSDAKNLSLTSRILNLLKI